MSEEYRPPDEVLGRSIRAMMDRDRGSTWEALHAALLHGICNRLERLVQVLEQIRDRLPGQVAK